MKFVEALAICVLAFSSGCRSSLLEETLREDNLLSGLSDEYFAEWTRFYPVEATIRGHHEYDGELGKVTAAAIQDRLRWVKDFRQRLLGVDVANLTRSSYIDLLLLTRAAKEEIESLESRGDWKRSPLYYSRTLEAAVQGLLRGASPAESRIPPLLSRLGQIPSFLEAARANLESPPRILVEESVAQLRTVSGTIESLPTLWGKSSSPRKLSELDRLSRESVQAIARFIVHLDSESPSQASPTFALGSDTLRRALLYEEMEDTPLDTIRGICEREMREIRTRMDDIVHRLDPAASTKSMLATPVREHPPFSELAESMATTLQDILRFVQTHKLFESSSWGDLRFIETPFAYRDNGWMSLDAAGPLEMGEQPSYFMLTTRDTEWPSQPSEAGLEPFDARALRLAAIREIYPGRLFNDSHQRASKSRIRRLLISKSSADGWSHYVEQLMLDEGFGWEDPVLRLMQLQNALVELGRLTTVIALHSGEITVDQAARFLTEQAFLGSEEAVREARQVACDWTRGSAALGKLQVLKLRDDYFEDRPSATLGTFHEDLLAGAGLPLKLVRLLLSPEDQRATLKY